MLRRIKMVFHQYLARPIYQAIRPFQPILNLKKRTFFAKFKVVTNNGVEFWLYNNAFYWETEIFWQGFEEINWEKKTREIWEELAQKSEVILDVGANTGIFSILAKANNLKAIIHSFEPQPNVFRILQKNNSINDFDINCHQLALSSEQGSMPFYNTGYSTFEGNNTTHGSLNKEWRTENQYSINVHVERLDQFLDKRQIGHVDLIKIDVETFEFEVLKGYGELLFKHRPVLILEIQNVAIGDSLKKLFEEKEYLFFWINEEKGIFLVKDLGRNTSEENLNYLLCPKEKLSIIARFIY